MLCCVAIATRNGCESSGKKLVCKYFGRATKAH